MFNGMVGPISPLHLSPLSGDHYSKSATPAARMNAMLGGRTSSPISAGAQPGSVTPSVVVDSPRSPSPALSSTSSSAASKEIVSPKAQKSKDSSSTSSPSSSSSKSGGSGSGNNPYAHLLKNKSNCDELAKVECHLENKELWDKFHELGTEMIITKTGR